MRGGETRKEESFISTGKVLQIIILGKSIHDLARFNKGCSSAALKKPVPKDSNTLNV